jgi:oligopeptide/dipeptide ABC transporter ATP-binding protein
LAGPAETTTTTDTLVVEHIGVTFDGHPPVVAVSDVSLRVAPGQTLGIVGESGSGKSVTVRAIMGLLGSSATVSGSARLNGIELIGLSERRMRRHRGIELAMVFQDPMSSLNPTMRIGTQVAEAVRHHRNVSRAQGWTEAVDLLRAVRVPDAERRARDYPHQLSGGMRQRVMLAMALSARPSLLIADEPTTALDVTTQAQILALLDDLKHRYGMAVILITHDLGVASRHTDQLAVMYAGKVVESAPTTTLVGAKRMPYTQALMDAIPSMEAVTHSPLQSIDGSPPDPTHLPTGCAFAPRCRSAREKCELSAPQLTEGEPGHSWACWFPLGVGDG